MKIHGAFKNKLGDQKYIKSTDIKNSFNMGKYRRRTDQKDMTIYL